MIDCSLFETIIDISTGKHLLALLPINQVFGSWQTFPTFRRFHFKGVFTSFFFLLKTSYFLCNSRCHVSIPNLREGNNFRLRCVRKKKPNSQQFMNENTFMLISLIKKTHLKVFISVFLKSKSLEKFLQQIRCKKLLVCRG